MKKTFQMDARIHSPRCVYKFPLKTRVQFMVAVSSEKTAWNPFGQGRWFRPWGKWSSNSRHFQACSGHQWSSLWQTRSICFSPKKGIYKMCQSRIHLSPAPSTVPHLGMVIADFFLLAVLFKGTCSLMFWHLFTWLLGIHVPEPKPPWPKGPQPIPIISHPPLPFIPCHGAGPRRLPQWTSTKCLEHGGK